MPTPHASGPPAPHNPATPPAGTKPAPLPALRAEALPALHIEPFHYPADPHAPSVPPSLGWLEGASETDDAALSAGFEQRLAEETRRAFEAGRERALDEQRKALAAEQAAAREREKRQLAALLESFHAERDRYLHRVEQEVVRLALAVAARILRREAQMDPLLLTGAVRVALGQLSASTEVRLRVPAADLALWTEAMALLPNLPVKPLVQGDDALRPGECLLETRLGSVDLGVRSQLGEIERGFFDRAPASQPASQPVLEAGSSSARGERPA
jgi:flagellar assembly protein FliH